MLGHFVLPSVLNPARNVTMRSGHAKGARSRMPIQPTCAVYVAQKERHCCRLLSMIVKSLQNEP